MSSHLLDVAAELTARNLQPPTLAELAQAAGVSRATVYRAFTHQQGLVDQLRARGVAVPEGSRVVFDAVRAVLLADGLDGFSLDAVARRAGVSVATLHRRHGGRDALLFAFFDQLPPRRDAWSLPADGPATDALTTFATALSRWLFDDGALLLAALSSSPETRRRLGALREAGLGTQEALAEWLRVRGEAAGQPIADPLRAARAFLGGVVGQSLGGPLDAAGARWWAERFLHAMGIP